jgi:hypothetical protein
MQRIVKKLGWRYWKDWMGTSWRPSGAEAWKYVDEDWAITLRDRSDSPRHSE